MTAISFGLSTRSSHSDQTKASVQAGRATGARELRQQTDNAVAASLAFRTQEFETGFVDFLLGRGARHSR